MDSGREAIGDASELAQIRHQAQVVHTKSFLLGMVLFAIAMSVPHLG